MSSSGSSVGSIRDFVSTKERQMEEIEHALKNLKVLEKLGPKFARMDLVDASPSSAHFKTRIEKVINLQKLVENLDKIRVILNKGFHVIVANANFHCSFTSIPIEETRQILEADLAILNEQAEQVETRYNDLKNEVKNLEQESDQTLIENITKRSEEIYNQFKLLDLRFKVLEANVRLLGLHYSTELKITALPFRGLNQPVNPILSELYRDPPGEFNDQEYYLWSQGIFRAIADVYQCARENIFVRDFEFRQIYRALFSCEDFPGIKDLLEDLDADFDDSPTPNLDESYELLITGIQRIEWDFEGTGMIPILELVMTDLLDVMESTCLVLNTRSLLHDYDLKRKRHFIRRINGYLPTQEFFPGENPALIDEVTNDQISQHYYELRGLGINRAYQRIGPDGNVLQEALVDLGHDILRRGPRRG